MYDACVCKYMYTQARAMCVFLPPRMTYDMGRRVMNDDMQEQQMVNEKRKQRKKAYCVQFMN